MNSKADCRTALASPGQNIFSLEKGSIKKHLFIHILWIAAGGGGGGAAEGVKQEGGGGPGGG